MDAQNVLNNNNARARSHSGSPLLLLLLHVCQFLALAWEKKCKLPQPPPHDAPFSALKSFSFALFFPTAAAMPSVHHIVMILSGVFEVRTISLDYPGGSSSSVARLSFLTEFILVAIWGKVLLHLVHYLFDLEP